VAGRHVGDGRIVRFIKALITLYVSLWKAWSVPPSNPTLEWAEANRRARAIRHHSPRRDGQGLGVRQHLYDQEHNYTVRNHDHDWEWPEDNDIHSLDERFHAIIEKMRGLPGINAEDLRLAYLGFDIAYPTDGDVEADFQAWLNTPEGKFRQYLNNNGEVT
jgi:hypothetical protein